MQYEMPAMTEEDRQTLIGLCRIEVSRWKNASEAVPDKRYMVELMELALFALMGKITAVPEGWQLVPVEPTRQMMSQGHFAMAGTDRGKFRRIYQAMVAAAPEALCSSASSS